MTRSTVKIVADKKGHAHFVEAQKILADLKKARSKRDLTKEEQAKLNEAEAITKANFGDGGDSDGSDADVERKEPEDKDADDKDQDPEHSDDDDPSKRIVATFEGEDINARMDDFFGFMVQRHLDQLTTRAVQESKDAAEASTSGTSSEKGKGIPGKKKSKSSTTVSASDSSAAAPAQSGAGIDQSIDLLVQDAVHDEDDKEDDSDSEFCSQFFDVDLGLGEPFSKAINNILSVGLLNEFPVEQLKELDQKHPMPAGCDALFIPQVNKPIWRSVSGPGKQRDKVLQNIQSYFIKACIPLMREMQLKVSQRDKEGAARLSDVLKYVGCGFRYINTQQKQLMGPEMNECYRPLAQHVEYPITPLLFGEDLVKQMTDIETTNKISKQVAVKRKPDFKRSFPKKQKFQRFSSDKSRSSRQFQKPGFKSFMQKKFDFLENQQNGSSPHQSNRPTQGYQGNNSNSSSNKPQPSKKK